MPVIVNRKLVFVGGIHGVGKTTVCRTSCVELGLNYLSAGELIKQNKIRRAQQDLDDGKRVANIDGNQDALTIELDSVIAAGQSYLLDGHFTLFDSRGQVDRIPLETFQKIHPKAVIVLTDAPEEISRRLFERDKTRYPTTLLARMQHEELRHASLVAETLGIRIHEITMEDSGRVKATIIDEIA